MGDMARGHRGHGTGGRCTWCKGQQGTWLWGTGDTVVGTKPEDTGDMAQRAGDIGDMARGQTGDTGDMVVGTKWDVARGRETGGRGQGDTGWGIRE